MKTTTQLSQSSSQRQIQYVKIDPILERPQYYSTKKKTPKNTHERTYSQTKFQESSHNHSIKQFYQKSPVIEQFNDGLRRLIKRKKYKSASKLQERINRFIFLTNEKSLRRLSQKQSRQMRSVSTSHQEQIYEFERVWKKIFKQRNQRQQIALINFKAEQQQDISIANEKVAIKIDHLKVNSKQLSLLKVQQIQLAKAKRFEVLVNIKEQKKSIARKLKEQRNYMIKNLIKVEENKLRQKHQKKYNYLVMRLNEEREIQQKVYRKNKKRLYQKYKNAVSQLQHEHSLQKQQLQKNLNKSFYREN